MRLGAIALVGMLVLSGCGKSGDGPKSAGGATAPVRVSAEALAWETRTDPVEQAFTIELPKGWRNDAYLHRRGVVAVSVATSEAPDGAVALFTGDPKLRPFVEPESAMPHQRDDPNVRIQAYTPAATFLPAYVKKRFASLKGLKIVAVADEPELVARNREKAREAGLALAQAHSARVDFTYQDRGRTRRGSVYGSTYSPGLVWMASVAGIVADADPGEWKAALFHVIGSQKTLAPWREKERVAAADRQRRHEETMAQIARNTEQLRRNHQNNMAILDGMAARHQIRMDAIHAAGDASMAAYRSRDAASDRNHRGFLNVITEENTVGTASGRTFQADNRYERYYLNKRDNTYIGLSGGTQLNDLKGVDPSDYEEGKVLR